MKNVKRFTALVLAVLICAACLSACGSSEPTYKVSIVDALGNPYTAGVVVKFMQNGTQAGMQVVGENGVAEKALPKGDYTVELQFTDSDVVYDYEGNDLTLSASKTELEIVLNYGLGENSQSLFVTDRDYDAYYVTTGCTKIELDGEKKRYFLFAPTQEGTYEFSLVGSDAAIGYYGAPHYVQSASAAEVVDNKFTISITDDMIGTGTTGTTVLVIGVDAGEGSAVLAIERIGAHQWSVADEPWTVYEAKTAPQQYTLPTGAKLGQFDLTGDYELVLGADGYYHVGSESGPLVLVCLGEASKPQYLDPYEVILEHTGVNKYFFDENGNFVKKEDYADCLLGYIGCVDEETGLYPLTEDLKYIIQSSGENNGWWDPEKNYIFLDTAGEKVPGINHDIAWLFMCCFIED